MTIILLGLGIIVVTWPIAYYLFHRIIYELKMDIHVIGKRLSSLYILIIQLTLIIAIQLILILILYTET